MIALRSSAPNLTAGGGAADAKGVLATDEEGNFSLEPVLIGREESHHAAEVIVMAVAQH